MSRRLAALGLLLCACGSGPRFVDPGFDGLVLDELAPGLILPGTKLVVRGRNFVDVDLGASRLAIDADLNGTRRRFSLPATYVSSSRLEVAVDEEFIDGVGGKLDGQLVGEATIELRARADASLHLSSTKAIDLTLAGQSAPTLDAVADGPSWVNQPIELSGGGMLLGGDEGEAQVRITGCFTPTSASTCNAAVDLMLATSAVDELDRAHRRFAYATSISGIGTGRFQGTLVLVNHHKSGLTLTSQPRTIQLEIQRARVTGASTTAASLGQYVDIEGNGFIGATSSITADESTVLQLAGTFTDQAGKATPLALVLIPEFVSGPRLRYVLDETDSLGQLIDLRQKSGTIVGTIKPTLQKGTEKVDGEAIPVTLKILPVKQVLHVRFLNSYLSSLRLFGLRAADALIRKRAIALTAEIVRSINLEVRADEPTDFALYSMVDIAGPDPNGQGLLGYDNTPGKDVDNKRLYDRIGGVNALTQSDGKAGYGGVFTESFFGFSEHPNELAKSTSPEPLFDRIFDPFRPDADGTPLTTAELEQLAPPELTDGASCPADGDRRKQVSCAVWALGNLIASTMIHEVGHSLGLAEPYGSPTTFHNVGDLPNRLMESGGARPFAERTVIGEGPAQFCQDEYTYLRTILASEEPATTFERQPCD